jgi:hypothetical protein
MKNYLVFAQFCSGAGRKAALALCLPFCTLGLGLSANGEQDKAEIVTFDVQGAGTGANQGTEALGINLEGAITGVYIDEHNVWRGFLRAPDGIVTSFEVPGAAGTGAESINPAGVITAPYWDAKGVYHGYLRAPDGRITTFDAPGAGSLAESFQGTFSTSVNLTGWISGFIVDDSGVYHGFLRSPDGELSTFNARGAGKGAGQGTWPAGISGINQWGVTAGTYVDTSGVFHGFVRTRGGIITEFDVRGAGTGAGQGTQPSSINQEGAITGSYVDADGVSHGFLRAPDGKITKFDYADAGTGSGQGTFGININTSGEIAAEYIDAEDVNHGLVRTPDGKLTRFDCPAKDAGTGSGQGTIPMSNNPAGVITGYCIDANGVLHGFLWTP